MISPGLPHWIVEIGSLNEKEEDKYLLKHNSQSAHAQWDICNVVLADTTAADCKASKFRAEESGKDPIFTICFRDTPQFVIISSDKCKYHCQTFC